MPTSDARASEAALSADLRALFAVEIPVAVLDRLDERIRTGVQAHRPPLATTQARLRPGRRATLVGLLAAALAIGGANGSLRALYLVLAGPFDVPWHRGVELNLSQTVDGYRVTIDRAYADATRLALAISVVDERRRGGTTQLAAFSTVVTDASGEYGGLGAVSSPDGPFAAVNVAWKTPAELPLPSGLRQFHVVLPFIGVRGDSSPPPDADAIGWNPWYHVAGPWTFDFEIEVDGGTAVMPNAVADANGIRATVTRLIAAPSIVRVDLRIEGTPDASGWNPIGEVRHNGRVQEFVVGSTEPDGALALMTNGGVGEPSGHWTVTFSSLTTRDDANAPGSPTTPWVVEFDVP